MRRILIVFAFAAAPAAAAAAPLYADESAARLPPAITAGRSMDAAVADLDGDGDLDILVAMEFVPNVLLLNDGTGRFTDGSDRLPRGEHDSEDIALIDADGDGDLDAVIVCEDDRVKEFWLNDGAGGFSDVSDRLPQDHVTNGVAAGDLDGDGDLDLVLANAGADLVWFADSAGGFDTGRTDALPAHDEVTQDVQLGDVDGDGDLDIVAAGEAVNRLYLNDGTGRFAEAPLPPRAGGEETRQAALGDIDGDGDLDLAFGNVRFFGAADPQDRLLTGDGAGGFADETAARLPPDTQNAAHLGFLDLDGDGDLDIVSSDVQAIRAPGTGRLRALLNDGTGRFSEAAGAVFPASAAGNGFDVAAGDFDGDGRIDLYVANRIGADLILMRRE